MKLILIIATMLAYSYGSPLIQLQHPTPVSPGVLVVDKPKEKVELISDPNETITISREAEKSLYSVVLPKEHEYKRKAHGIESSHITIPKAKNPETATITEKKPLNISQNSNKPNLNGRLRRNVDIRQINNEPKHILMNELKHASGEILQKTIESKNYDNESASASNNGNKDADQKCLVGHFESEIKQKLPIAFTFVQQGANNSMYEPEQSLNKINSMENQVAKTENSKYISSSSTILLPLRAKQNDSKSDITIQESQSSSPVSLVPKEMSSRSHLHKRDWPVPLVPKRHHPEKSVEDIEKNEQLENKTRNGESKEQPSKVEQLTLQSPSENSKNTRDPPQREARQSTISTASNQGILKDSEFENEMKLKNSLPHVPQILLRHSHENITTVRSYSPHTLSIHHFIPNDNQHHDGQNNYTSQSLLTHNKSFHQEQIVADNNQKSNQTSPTTQTHNHTQVSIKEQILPKTSNDNKQEETKSTDKPINTHTVQKDVPESAVSPKPAHHMQIDHKTNEPDNLSSAPEFTTTTHSIIRKRPVPVSELFSRAQGNSTTNYAKF